MAATQTAQSFAVDDRYDRRRTARRDTHDVATDRRSGKGGDIVDRFGLDFVDAVISGHQARQNKWFVQTRAASSRDGERLAGRIARAGNAQRCV